MSWMKQGLGNDQEAADPKTLQTISGFPHRHWVHSCAPTTASVQAIMVSHESSLHYFLWISKVEECKFLRSELQFNQKEGLYFHGF